MDFLLAMAGSLSIVLGQKKADDDKPIETYVIRECVLQGQPCAAGPCTTTVRLVYALTSAAYFITSGDGVCFVPHRTEKGRTVAEIVYRSSTHTISAIV